MALIGDTVRFEADFRDYDNNKVDVTDVAFSIYQRDGTKIETVTLNQYNTLEDGSYYIDYELPSDTQEDVLVYEFSGKNFKKRFLSRAHIQLEFV